MSPFLHLRRISAPSSLFRSAVRYGVASALFFSSVSDVLAGDKARDDRSIPLPEDERVFSYDNVYTIRIHEATWGKNCEGKKIHRRTKNPTLARLRHRIEHNNVLPAVQKLCDGEKSCSFEVSEDTFKVDPAKDCTKHLSIFYRCFSYDTPHYISMRQGRTMSIDCGDDDTEDDDE